MRGYSLNFDQGYDLVKKMFTPFKTYSEPEDQPLSRRNLIDRFDGYSLDEYGFDQSFDFTAVLLLKCFFLLILLIISGVILLIALILALAIKKPIF